MSDFSRGLASIGIAMPMVLCAPLSAQFLDYDPSAPEVVLNTDFTQITPVGAPPINVSGGVFVFRNVRLREGVTVRGIGSNPMTWIVFGDFIVEGRLKVDGVDGDSVFTLSSANFPTAGGSGVCTGGNGGRGSPSPIGLSPQGDTGFGAFQIPGLGGLGGLVAMPGCSRGSGGGGGSFATIGDPYFPLPAGLRPIGAFPQFEGRGGDGCDGAHSGVPSRNLAGGAPGARPFVDARPDNDFWGLGFNVRSFRPVIGELTGPRGGTGGGGGGDRAHFSFPNHNKGGGGGGGAGALVIIAVGRIIVGQNGCISANGGNGGGGEQAGSNNQGGGGGGGSGGMVVLYSLGGVVLHARGETFRNGDYDFSLAADGGVGTQPSFAQTTWNSKYPPPTQWSGRGSWDEFPAGGFGGLGVIELITRPGTDADGTGTILDDGISILGPGGAALTGTEKRRYLGWRGFPNQNGVWVDDTNVATGFNAGGEGDLRPAPILLPALY